MYGIGRRVDRENAHLRAQLASWEDLLCHEHDPSGTADKDECISCQRDGLRARLAKHHEGSGLPAHRCVTCVVEYTP